jgi:N-acetylglucosaminyldiphosphoundecaprenol N-acetyl-beta-D-mannosaminyltransferase
MGKYFNIILEFDHSVFYETIERAIKYKIKGYVCVVDANILSMAQKNLNYRSIINSSLINTCDGSSIALMASWIHNSKFEALNGPEIFKTLIRKPVKQVLIGNTDDVIERIKQKLISDSVGHKHIFTIPLPFCSVDDFDYIGIAKVVDEISPDIIWVSLGAPKQEIFISRLIPNIRHGVMFGIGAAFNFYIGELSLSSYKIGRFYFTWLNRLIQEPGKSSKRVFQILLTFPKMFLKEIKRARIHKDL